MHKMEGSRPRRARRLAAGLMAGIALWACQGGAVAHEVRVGGTGGAMGLMQELAHGYARKDRDLKITVLPSLGSSGGIRAVLAGKIDLAATARPLRKSEILQGASQVELGCTPVLFATAMDRPDVSLTHAELADIYRGKIQKWPDGQKIRLVLRPADESDTELLLNMSGAMKQAIEAALQRKGMPFAVTDQEAADSIERIPGALGTVTLAQLRTEQRKLKALQLEQVDGTPENVSNRRYPLCRRLYLVTSPQASVQTRQFFGYILSEAGRAQLRRSGLAQF